MSLKTDVSIQKKIGGDYKTKIILVDNIVQRIMLYEVEVWR